MRKIADAVYCSLYRPLRRVCDRTIYIERVRRTKGKWSRVSSNGCAVPWPLDWRGASGSADSSAWSGGKSYFTAMTGLARLRVRDLGSLRITNSNTSRRLRRDPTGRRPTQHAPQRAETREWPKVLVTPIPAAREVRNLRMSVVSKHHRQPPMLLSLSICLRRPTLLAVDTKDFAPSRCFCGEVLAHQAERARRPHPVACFSHLARSHRPGA